MYRALSRSLLHPAARVLKSRAALSTVSSSDVEQLREIFDRYDIDQNGSLDENEISLFFSDATGSQPTNEELGFMIAEIDEDGDGRVSFDEMQVLLQGREVTDQKNLPQRATLRGDWVLSTEPITILVIPSTGNVGFETARALAEAGPHVKVRCGYRDQSNDQMKALVHSLGDEHQNVDLVKCDYNDMESLVQAMEGVERVMTCTPTTNNKVGKWSTTQINVAHAAKQSGVECVLWVSGQAEVLDPESLWVKNQIHTEETIRSLDVPLLEVRPNMLISNLYGMRDSIVKTGVNYIGWSADAEIVQTHPSDVAQLSACLLAAPKQDLDEHLQKGHYTVTGPRPCSMKEVTSLMCDTITAHEKLGRTRIAYQDNLMQLFASFDTNADGRLSQSELSKALLSSGYNQAQAARILNNVPASGLAPDQFVDMMSSYVKGMAEVLPRVVNVVINKDDFYGFCQGAGMSHEAIELIQSLNKSIEEGFACGEDAVDFEDFVRIVGREPYSPEQWVNENVGAFMASHWDVAVTHARHDQIVKTSWFI